MKLSRPIYTCLWFNNQAGEAAQFYCSVFDDGKILDQNPVVTTFKINETKFMALNGGSQHKLTPATSFVIECDTQEQIDYYWNALTKDGQPGQCGWLVDKFGVSWQVVPTILSKLMEDPEKASRVTSVFMKMTKFEIEGLLKA